VVRYVPPVAERDLYALLGVPRGATGDEIKKAYRRLAHKYHPDKNPGNKQAEERFKEITAAHEVLGDPRRRKLYDEFGADSLRSGFDPARADQYRQWQRQGGARPFDFGGFETGGGSGAFDFGSIFEQIFGAGAARQRRGRGEDVRADLEVELADAVKGAERDLQLDGRTLRVKIPAGVGDGSQIRLAGQGTPGPGGGPAGDLYLEVRLKAHPLLRRDGRDLTIDLPVTVPEAVNGAEVTLPTFDGPVRLRIPAGAQAGTRLRLRGRGMPGLKGERGDLYAVVKVVLPDADDRLRKAVEPLAALYKDDPRAGISL